MIKLIKQDSVNRRRFDYQALLSFVSNNKIHLLNKYDDNVKRETQIVFNCLTYGCKSEISLSLRSLLNGSGSHLFCKYCIFLQKAKDKHGDKYDYSKVIYEDSDTKVIIVCEKHGEFHQLPSNHLAGQGCPDCARVQTNQKRKLTTEDFISKAKDKHGDKYDYSRVKYENSETNVIIICKAKDEDGYIHGEFPQNPGNHFRGVGCPKCSGKYRPTTEDFIVKAKKKHGDATYDYSETVYNGSDIPVIIKCKVHGNFLKSPKTHLRGEGCQKCSRNYEPTTEGWIEYAKTIHGDKYDYSNVIYNGSDNKVIIICKEHGEFPQTPSNHCNNKNGCPKCANNIKFNTEQWISKATEKHGDKYDYSRVVYNISSEKVIIICKVHGEFEQGANSHLKGSGCNKCGCIVTGNKLRSNKDDWIACCSKIHDYKYDYTKVVYSTKDDYATIICPKHGEFEQTLGSHKMGHGCAKCEFENNGDRNRKSLETFVAESREIHGEKYDYSKVEYINGHTNVTIICMEHGEFPMTPSSHIHHGSGCPSCSKFKSENLCRSILQELTGYQFIKIRPSFLQGLELDGYCEELKIAFEYQGEQHYYYNPHFHRNGIRDLISQNLRDKIKKNICDKTRIRLIIIPYRYTFKDIEKMTCYINSFLKNISIKNEADS